MAKPDLSAITARAAARLAQPKGGKPTRSEPKAEPQMELPLAELLKDAIPSPTDFERAWDQAEQARRAQPRPKPGPDPRIPWTGKGKMTEPAPLAALPPMTKVALNNAIAKARLGQRLTLKDRKLIGKHELAQIMTRVRPKSGDGG